jgi:hypothetical protein
MTADEWRERIKEATAARKTHGEEWLAALAAYRAALLAELSEDDNGRS